MTSEPILTYRENALGTKSTIRVFHDRVEIMGSEVFGGSAEWSVPLRMLQPTPVYGKYRNSLFNFGLVAWMLWGVAYYMLSRLPGVELFASRWGFFWSIPLFCLVLVAATVKRVRYASFMNDSGMVVMGLRKNPPGHRKFEETVQRLSELIREARERPETPAGPRDSGADPPPDP